MPMYDFHCDVCGALVEVVVPYADRNKAVPHNQESEVECLGMLRREPLTPVAGMGHGMGDTKLDGRHQTKAIVYNGEQKVGYVDGHFGKAAKKK